MSKLRIKTKSKVTMDDLVNSIIDQFEFETDWVLKLVKEIDSSIVLVRLLITLLMFKMVRFY
jgi:hypothetical protein